MTPEHKQIPARDIGVAWFDDRIFIRKTHLAFFADQMIEFVVGPKLREIDTVRFELLQHGGVPLKIQFSDAVVREREFTSAGIRFHIEIESLNDDQLLS